MRNKTRIKQVRFTEDQNKKIEQAVDKYNSKVSFGIITRSDLIRQGTMELVKKILLAKKLKMVFEE